VSAGRHRIRTRTRAVSPLHPTGEAIATLARVETVELEGRRLGERYRLESPIASGGMASVWRATDEVLGRPVAVKVLHEDLTGDRELLERFRMEAIAAARLSHPSVVRVFDTGVDDGVCYIVMELSEGTTLAHILDRDGPMPPDEAARIVRGALQGLAHAHREGVVHRDVKPSNILIDESGLVKVTDFGIAKAAFAGHDLTTTGSLLGTATYLAPEQVEGAPVDARADLYAAGIVLYEALAGRPPFAAETHLATATMRLTKTPPPPGALRPGIPRPLEQVVATALARAPEDRFQSAEEMAAALDRASPVARPDIGPSISEPAPAAAGAGRWFRSWMMVPLALLVLAGLAVGGYFLFEDLNLGSGGGGTDSQPERLEPLEIAGATDHDPYGGDGEYSEDTRFAIDGALETYWQTEGYEQTDMDKPGVGIYFDLGEPTEVGRVRIRTPVGGWWFQIKGSDDGQTFGSAVPGEDGNRSFVARHGGEEPVVVNIEPNSHRYFLIWIVALPEDVSPHRVQITEVDLFPPRE
jgi:eukaryotic-like serine/threonine-protein kinase